MVNHAMVKQLTTCSSHHHHHHHHLGHTVSGCRSPFYLFLTVVSALQVVCTEGPDRVKELIDFGASFDHGNDGKLHLAREGGHSHHRIVHAADMTGREIERALLKAVSDDPNIFMFGHHFAIDLLTSQVLIPTPTLPSPLIFHLNHHQFCTFCVISSWV